jgi:thiamine kinase-like enzyme
MWADNLRSTPSGELCVFDWDNAGPGDPSRELAVVLYEFAYGDAARARALHDAYVAAGGPGRVTHRSDFSMAIAQLGHITEMACARWLDGGPTPRAHNEARVRELTDRPLTRAVIDELLDAVG